MRFAILNFERSTCGNRKKNVTHLSFDVSSCNCTSFRKTNSHDLLHLHHLRNCTWFKLPQHATVWKTCRQQVNKYKKRRRERACIAYMESTVDFDLYHSFLFQTCFIVFATFSFIVKHPNKSYLT